MLLDEPDEPPRHRGPRGHRGVPRGVARDDPRRSPTTGGCSRRSARSCGSSTTGSRCRSTAATAPGARRSPTAGRSRPRRRSAHAPVGPPARPAAGDACRSWRPAPPVEVASRRQRGRRRHRARRPELARGCRRTRTARRRETLDSELGRLGLRKSQLELAMGIPVDLVELRGDAPGDERARGRRAGPRRGRGRVAGAGGAGTVTFGVRTVRIGITGPIGCGKSQVAAWLAELGVHVVDADDEARAVTSPGQPTHDLVLRRWPEAAGPDGTLDRKALGRIVFSDPVGPARARAARPPRRAAEDPRPDRGGGGARARRRS